MFEWLIPLNNKTRYSETELIEMLRQRSETSFSYLYDNYSDALYGIVFHIVNSEEIAEDLMQEAFVRIWQNFDSYDKNKGKLFTWMLNIARNAAIDHIRSAQFKHDGKNRSIDDFVNIIHTNQNTSSRTDQIGLKETLLKLKPDHKIIIDLIYFKGYTQAEVSEELAMPLGTVKTRARTALLQLREILR